MSLDKNRIRLQLELSKVGDPNTPIINLFTGRTPVFPRSRDTQIEIVLLNNGILDTSVANISSLTLEVKPYLQPSAASLITVNLIATDIDATVTDADNAAATKQHALVVMTAGMTGLNMAAADAANNLTLSLVITAVRNGNSVTLSDGTIVCHSDGGVYSGNTPTAGDPTYFTKAEVLGLLADMMKIFNDPGVPLILRNQENTFQRRLGVDTAGVRTDDVSPIS